MTTFKGLLVGSMPHSKDKKSYAADFVRPVECEAEDDAYVLTEFSILADAEQRARRAHGAKGLLVRYVLDAE